MSILPTQRMICLSKEHSAVPAWAPAWANASGFHLIASWHLHITFPRGSPICADGFNDLIRLLPGQGLWALAQAQHLCPSSLWAHSLYLTVFFFVFPLTLLFLFLYLLHSQPLSILQLFNNLKCQNDQEDWSINPSSLTWGMTLSMWQFLWTSVNSFIKWEYENTHILRSWWG